MPKNAISPKMLEAIRSLQQTTGTVHEPAARDVIGGFAVARALLVRGLALSPDFRRGARVQPVSLVKLGDAGRALLVMGAVAADGWRCRRMQPELSEVLSPDRRRAFLVDNRDSTASYTDADLPNCVVGRAADVLERMRVLALERRARAQGLGIVKDPIRSVYE